MAPSSKASKPVKKPAAAKAAANKATAKATTTVAAKPVRKAAITATSPATVRPVVVSTSPASSSAAGPKPAYGFGQKTGASERPNINLADTPWIENFKRFAAENPAMTLVGIVSVTLALILMLD